MPKYEYVGDTPRSIPALGLVVQPGQRIDVAEEINNGDFVLLREKAAKAPKDQEATGAASAG